MALRIMDTADRAIDVADRHFGYLIGRFEEEVGYKPVKVAMWGVATASVLTAVAAGLAVTAAAAGAYVAVRAARRARAEARAAEQSHQTHRTQWHRSPGTPFTSVQGMGTKATAAYPTGPQSGM